MIKLVVYILDVISSIHYYVSYACMLVFLMPYRLEDLIFLNYQNQKMCSYIAFVFIIVSKSVL